MKSTYYLIVLSVLIGNVLSAQNLSKPLDYIKYFNKEFVEIQRMQVEYSSCLIHRRDELASRKRRRMLNKAKDIKEQFEGIKAIGKDQDLRKNAIKTLDVLINLAETDYQSMVEDELNCYDCYEGLQLEYELSSKDAKQIGVYLERYQRSIKKFAKSKKIELVYNDAEFNQLVADINEVNEYVRGIDLAITQVQLADNKIIEALNEKDIKSAKEALDDLNYAVKGAEEKLAKVKRLKVDKSLLTKAKKLVSFYKEAGETIYPELLAAFDEKGNVINAKVSVYNKGIKKLNEGANKEGKDYLKNRKQLLEKYIPELNERVQGP